MFVFIRHWYMKNKLSNAEYDSNPFNRSGASKRDIHTDRLHLGARNVYVFQNRQSNVSTITIPFHTPINYAYEKGRPLAQAVSLPLPTAATRVQDHVRPCGFCGGQSGTGAGFLRVFRFTLPILIPPNAPHSSYIIRGWYNRPLSGRSTKWTEAHPSPKN
jgi:hypothetical protein